MHRLAAIFTRPRCPASGIFRTNHRTISTPPLRRTSTGCQATFRRAQACTRVQARCCLISRDQRMSARRTCLDQPQVTAPKRTSLGQASRCLATTVHAPRLPLGSLPGLARATSHRLRRRRRPDQRPLPSNGASACARRQAYSSDRAVVARPARQTCRPTHATDTRAQFPRSRHV